MRVDPRGDLVEVIRMVIGPLVEVHGQRLEHVRRRGDVDDPGLLIRELLHPRQVHQRLCAHRRVRVINHLPVPLHRLGGQYTDVANGVTLVVNQHGVAHVKRVDDEDEDDGLEELLDAVAEHEHERQEHGRRGEPHLHDVLFEYAQHHEDQQKVQSREDDPLERGEDAGGARQTLGQIPSPFVNLHEASHDLFPPQHPGVVGIQHLHDLQTHLRRYPETGKEFICPDKKHTRRQTNS